MLSETNGIVKTRPNTLWFKVKLKLVREVAKWDLNIFLNTRKYKRNLKVSTEMVVHCMKWTGILN